MINTRCNAHKLFNGAPDAPDFWNATKVPDRQIESLRAARDIARAAIVQGFMHWDEKVSSNVLLEQGILRKITQPPVLKPKFHRQGSYSYGTLNSPAHQPPQQTDFDDGVFVPITFMQKQNHHVFQQSPIIASDGYFKLIETILQPICNENGWKLDSSKSSCVRILLDKKSHLDLALYAIPDKDFLTLVENAAVFDSAARQKIWDSVGLDEKVYKALAPDQMMLAHRVQGWIPSDPRKIEGWFQGAVETHGEQLRRMCRYLKAWRDYRWPNGSELSSIAIMKCTVDAYDSLKGTFPANRDDAALLMVARKLPEYFNSSAGIKNPILDLVLNDGWTPQHRLEYVKAAHELTAELSSAIESNSDPELALRRLTGAFGPRIPNDSDLVISLTAEATVKQFTPAKVPAPHVPRTTSG